MATQKSEKSDIIAGINLRDFQESLMSMAKRWLENLSHKMGKNGQITSEVMREAEKRLNVEDDVTIRDFLSKVVLDMSMTKQWLENLSVEMGKNGQITSEVMREAEERLNVQDWNANAAGEM